MPHGDARLAPFRDCLTESEPICGRLNPDKMQVLFGDEQESVAVGRPDSACRGVGLIAVGSRDGNRFFPGMGTLFLRLMGEAFSHAPWRVTRADEPVSPALNARIETSCATWQSSVACPATP